MPSSDDHLPDEPRRSSRRRRSGSRRPRQQELAQVPLDSLIEALVAPAVSELSVTKPAAAGPPAKRRVWNRLFLVRTFIALGLLIPAAIGWRAYQIVAQCGKLVERAELYEAQQDWNAAARTYFSYLRFFPDDVQVWVRMAESLDKRQSGIFQRAEVIGIYYETVARAPERVGLRRRLAELLLENERFAAAAQQADALLATDPVDVVGRRVRGLALYRQACLRSRSDWKEVETALREAAQVAPTDAPIARALADTYRRAAQTDGFDSAPEADAVMNRLVENNPQEPEAWLAYLDYCHQQSMAPSQAALDQALAVAPDSLEWLLEAGRQAQAQGNGETARSFFERMIAAAPTDRQGYLELGDSYLADGDTQLALDTWARGAVSVDPRDTLLQLRRADLLVDLGQLDPAERALEAIAAAQARLVPRPLPQNIEPSVAYVAARLDLARGRHYAAAARLEAALSQEPWQAVLSRGQGELPLRLVLVECYRALELWDRAADALEQAARLAPHPSGYHLAAGQAWEQAGAWAMAAAQYQAVLDDVPDSAEASLGLLRSLLGQLTRQAPSQRSLGGLAAALDSARQTNAGSTELARLEALAAAIRGQMSEATSGLAKLANEHPDQFRLIQSLIEMLDQSGETAEADRRLAQFTAQRPPIAGLAELAIDRLVRLGRLDEALNLIESQLSQASPEHHTIWQARQVELLRRAGRGAEARASLANLDADRQSDLPLWVARHALALDAGDADQARLCRQAIHEIEGDIGTAWRVAACQELLSDATDPSTEAQGLTRLAGEVLRLRPHWPVAEVLAGQVAERLDQPELAITHYRRAMEQGATDGLPLARLAALFSQQGQWNQVTQLLQSAEGSSGLDPAERDTIVVRLLDDGQIELALKLAELPAGNTQAPPARQRTWGRALLAAGRAAEARETLEAAARQGVSDPLNYLAWAEAVAATQPGDDLSAVLQAAAPHLSPAWQHLLSAWTCELRGRWAEATQAYQAAQQASPADGAIQRWVADFASGRREDLAAQAWRCLASARDGRLAAERLLLVALAREGAQSAWNEAWNLAGGRKTGDGELLPPVARLRVELLIERGFADDLLRAERMLQPLLDDPAAASEVDERLDAHLALAWRDRRAARERLRDLASREGNRGDDRQRLVELLMAEGQVDEARKWLNETTTSGELTLARQALAQDPARPNDRAVAAAAVEAELGRRLAQCVGPRAQARVWREAGHWLGLVGLAEQSQHCARRAQALDPASAGRMARAWLEAGAAQAAWPLAVEALAADPQPASVVLAVRALLARASRIVDYPSLAPALDAALAAHSENPSVLLAVAEARLRCDESADAVAPLRRVLELDPDDTTALGLLALARRLESDGQGEALQLAHRALALLPRSAWLIDIRGQVLLTAGKTPEALADFLEATELAHPRAAYYFHLACARQRAGDNRQARAAIERAFQEGLADEPLSPLEERHLAELKHQLER